ncbi:MAG: hypothetical protein V7K67_14600 [Nostoc sp.]|uniref:hypothetical protein n=1 Tax=Nostoc sp. TaxID=1180 RepID=UPI002FF13CFD
MLIYSFVITSYLKPDCARAISGKKALGIYIYSPEVRLSKTCWNSAVEGIAITSGTGLRPIAYSLQSRRSHLSYSINHHLSHAHLLGEDANQLAPKAAEISE